MEMAARRQLTWCSPSWCVQFQYLIKHLVVSYAYFNSQAKLFCPSRWWQLPFIVLPCVAEDIKVDGDGALSGESENTNGIPEHKSTETQEWQNPEHNSRKMRRQRISKWLLLPQKLWNPLHVPSRPFYRETNELLHFENTLESKKYS
jgi:hypothetical protein